MTQNAKRFDLKRNVKPIVNTVSLRKDKHQMT